VNLILCCSDYRLPIFTPGGELPFVTSYIRGTITR
jgi:hypothetical protein